MVQWLRICFPMQETWVRPLLGNQDPTFCRATKPTLRNYWARALRSPRGTREKAACHKSQRSHKKGRGGSKVTLPSLCPSFTPRFSSRGWSGWREGGQTKPSQASQGPGRGYQEGWPAVTTGTVDTNAGSGPDRRCESKGLLLIGVGLWETQPFCT